MKFVDLPQLEQTLPILGAYLLVAHERHPNELLGGFDSSTSGIKGKTRLTQHHVAALLSYGLPPQSPELQQAMRWFATSFTHIDELDLLEMTRLEGLMNIDPLHPGVKVRLQQLMVQRNEHFFELVRDGSVDAPTFDTLWGVKLIMDARRAGINTLIEDNELLKSIDHVIVASVRDKDTALALRLRYELTGELGKLGEEYLNKMLNTAEKFDNILGIRKKDWKRLNPIISAMRTRNLLPSLIVENQRLFRDFILDLCYVIENLVHLADDYPDVIKPIEDSMCLWWQQFRGNNPLGRMNLFFPREYDYIMVLCRTIVTVSNYLGQPPGASFWLMALREMSYKFNDEKYPEMSNIRKALREWIGVSINGYEKLKLGLSSANVVRINPTVFNPADERQKDLFDTTLIVKYGPIDEISNERKNYKAVPDAIKPAFVKIPEESFISDDQRAFVIIEDLDRHRTLYESFEDLLRYDPHGFSKKLTDFLLEIHASTKKRVLATNNHLRELYTLPMLAHVDFMVDRLQRFELGENARRFSKLEGHINDLIGDIMLHQFRLSSFPLAYMHGDLHTRNIMIGTPHNMPRKFADAELDFRLIDLESLRMDGDAAHDAGQLLIDLHLLQSPVSSRRDIPREIFEKINLLADDVTLAYLNYAEEQEDQYFSTRLNLAKARALLRIAKGRAKRSVIHFEALEAQLMHDAITDILNLSEEAVEYLELVYRDIKGPKRRRN